MVLRSLNRPFHVAGVAALMGAVACGSLLDVDFSDAHPAADAGGMPAGDAGKNSTPAASDGGSSVDAGEVALDCASRLSPCGDAACPGSSGDVIAIMDAGGGTCALKRNGTVRCWTFQRAPADVEGLPSVARFLPNPGWLVMARDGEVYSLDDDGARFSARRNPELAGYADVAFGTHHTCFLTAACTAQCVGGNQLGQLGDGTTLARTVPVDVINLDGGVARIVAGNSSSCAHMPDGIVKCWGEMWKLTDTPQAIPNDMPEISEASVITANGDQACFGIGDEGRVECFNYFYPDQGPMLGFVAGERIIDLAVGGLHVCALTRSGAVKCRGANGRGQLGNGMLSSEFSPAATNVVGLESGVVDITAAGAGSVQQCALLADGRVKCWGATGNQMDGVTVPLEVQGI